MRTWVLPNKMRWYLRWATVSGPHFTCELQLCRWSFVIKIALIKTKMLHEKYYKSPLKWWGFMLTIRQRGVTLGDVEMSFLASTLVSLIWNLSPLQAKVHVFGFWRVFCASISMLCGSYSNIICPIHRGLDDQDKYTIQFMKWVFYHRELYARSISIILRSKSTKIKVSFFTQTWAMSWRWGEGEGDMRCTFHLLIH